MGELINNEFGVPGGKINFDFILYQAGTNKTRVNPDNPASEPLATIYHPDGSVVTSGIGTKTAVGEYVYTYNIGGSEPASNSSEWSIEWFVTVSGIQKTFSEHFKVVTPAYAMSKWTGAEFDEQQLTPHQADLVDDFLLSLIGDAEKLQVYDEIGRMKADNKTALFTYDDWRTDYDPELRINDDSLLTEGVDFTVDRRDGIVTLTNTLSGGDELWATYQFQYFTRRELGSYLELTMRGLNGVKPVTAYSIESAPLEWDEVLVIGAAIKALEKIMFDHQIWRNHLIWADPEGARTYLQTLLSTLTADYQLKTSRRYFKRRGEAKPKGLSSGKFFTPMLIDGVNFRNYTIIGGG